MSKALGMVYENMVWWELGVYVDGSGRDGDRGGWSGVGIAKEDCDGRKWSWIGDRVVDVCAVVKSGMYV